jgi:hypothetical protein
MAWDTIAVLMDGCESAEKLAQFVEIHELTSSWEFEVNEMPDPRQFGRVGQRM